MFRETLAIPSFVAILVAARSAGGYCRTSTCALPADYSPSVEGECYPADFVATCQDQTTPVTPVPLWWRNACVSYDIQQNASVQVPYDTAALLAAEAFSKWTATICQTAGGWGRVSIDARDLGPVSCDQVQYNSDQGNQHVIIFRDDGSSDFDTINTLGLTTVTFDPTTGEIYDADMEINSSVTLAISDPVPSDGYDFQSIITHEAGHFLGLAHSVATDTTMYAIYSPGSTSKRILTADDMAGICAIYPPGGTRSVDPSVDPSGQVAQDFCDPTPRHGFQSQCSQPVSASCSASPVEPSSPPPVAIGAAALVGAAGAFRRWHHRRSDTRDRASSV
jgi:MYXO-CTERM domain-containing protein